MTSNALGVKGYYNDNGADKKVELSTDDYIQTLDNYSMLNFEVSCNL